MVVFINIERNSLPSLNLKNQELYNSRKYNEKQIAEVLDLLNKGLKIREIVKQTRIPETTIRNWKNGIVYVLRLSYKDQIKLFYDNIGFTIKRKQVKLEKLFNRKLLEEDRGMAAIV